MASAKPDTLMIGYGGMPQRLIDRLYHRYIKPFRFLYGWAKDGRARLRCAARAEEWQRKGFRGAKLDLCGGRYPFDPATYLNVDCVALPEVDLVFDIRRRFPFDDGVVAEVLSIATLEHIRQHDVHHVLRECFRVLMPGGMLRVSTPDIEGIARGILAGETPDVVNQHLFGRFKSGDTEDLDVHRWMYTATQMMDVLRTTGFTQVEQRPMEDIGMHDPRYNYLIRAVKP